jgi:hypothetical protein
MKNISKAAESPKCLLKIDFDHTVSGVCFLPKKKTLNTHGANKYVLYLQVNWKWIFVQQFQFILIITKKA